MTKVMVMDYEADKDRVTISKVPIEELEPSCQFVLDHTTDLYATPAYIKHRRSAQTR